MITGFDYDILRWVEIHDMRESLYWTCEDSNVNWWFFCNDVFHWGCADGEDVNQDNFLILKQSYDELIKIKNSYQTITFENYISTYDIINLFVSRVRKTRPQGAAYPRNKDIWPLFDACGEEREIGYGNPYRPGEYEEIKKNKAKGGIK